MKVRKSCVRLNHHCQSAVRYVAPTSAPSEASTYIDVENQAQELPLRRSLPRRIRAEVLARFFISFVLNIRAAVTAPSLVGAAFFVNYYSMSIITDYQFYKYHYY